MEQRHMTPVRRRDLLRWGGALTLAATLGCGPGPDQNGAASSDGAAAAPPQPDASDDDDAPGASDEAEDAPADDAPAEDAPADEVPRPTITVLCRESIALVPAVAGAQPHRPRQLTVHHSAVPLTADRLAPRRLRDHQRHHQSQGWADIAYHLAVDLRGNVYELRDPATAGDTFTGYDPTGHLGVVCEGDYTRQQPSEAMLDALAGTLAHLAGVWQVPADTLSGHRDHTATRCPGDHLYARLPELTREVARLSTPGVDRITVCGAEGRELVAAIEAGT